MFKFRLMLIALGVGVVIFGSALGQASADTVGYWEFNNALTDSSGLGHDGAMSSGSDSYVTDAGRTGILLSDTHVVVSASSDFAFSGDYTIEAAFKTSNASTAEIISQKGATDSQWWARTYLNKVQTIAMGTPWSEFLEVTADDVVNDGQWHQLAIVFNSSTDSMTMYIDNMVNPTTTLTENSLYSAISSTIGTSDGTLRIGDSAAGGEQWIGAIDFVRVSNVALGPGQFVDVPEPGTLALLAIGLLGLLAYAWRKRR